MWILNMAMYVEEDIARFHWSEDGILALERLGAFAQIASEERIHSAPNTLTEHTHRTHSYKYADTNWPKDDPINLRRIAAMSKREILEPGDFMKGTIAYVNVISEGCGAAG